MGSTCVEGGRWWRFSEYEIADGYIRPTWNAELKEYDPWAPFWRRQRGRVFRPPYAQLVNLTRDLSGSESGAVELSPASQHALTQWCSEYGLLGLLPHTTIAASIEGRTKEPGRTYFVRNVDGWDSWFEVGRADDGLPGRAEHRWNEVICQGASGMAHVQSIYDAWGRFFPRESHGRDWDTRIESPPTPLTEEFWYRYAEPVSEFVGAGQALGAALIGASAKHPFGLEALSRLAIGSQPVLEVSRQRRRLRWRAPSLLATLALMGMQDLTRERRLYQCPCGNVVTSTDPRTRYCSPLHRERYRKQGWRAKTNTKRAKRTSEPRPQRARRRAIVPGSESPLRS